MEQLVAERGQSAPTPREAAMGVEFFVCMVANSLQATVLLFQPDTGAVEAFPKNASILICSTVAHAYTDEVKRCLHEIGRSDICLTDSPVSGGVARAANGTLSIFSSGEENYLSNAHIILQYLSGKLYKVPGGLGDGSKAKFLRQIFAGGNIEMASEAMGIVAAARLKTQEIFDELRYGEGESWMFKNRVLHMLDPTLSLYSAITIIAKDVVSLLASPSMTQSSDICCCVRGMITSTARDFKFPLPMISTVEQIYMTAISAGWGKEDDCVITRLYLLGRLKLVLQRVKAIDDTRSTDLSVDDIKDLMDGVHLGTPRYRYESHI